MKIMLTAFGVGREEYGVDALSPFYLKPPALPGDGGGALLPDYAALVIAERVVMDATAYKLLVALPDPMFRGISGTYRALREQGYVELVDFNGLLDQHRRLTDRMMDHDTTVPSRWLPAAVESIRGWHDFASGAESVLRAWHSRTQRASRRSRRTRNRANLPLWWYVAGPSADEWMAPWEIDAAVALAEGADMIYVPPIRRLARLARFIPTNRHLRNHVIKFLIPFYLGYVNANLVLANELGAGIHDWAHLMPFYERKFLTVGHDGMESEKQVTSCRRLFEVSFPELAIRDTKSLLKALEDPRVEELRRLVEEAAEERTEFDQEFAHRTLSEVFRAERDTAHWRRMVSFVTAPLGFIPWIGTPLQKAAEEGLVRLHESKLKEPYRWFYLLSDIAEERDRGRPRDEQP